MGAAITELCELADKYGTDKGPAVHGYTAIYHWILKEIRPHVCGVLELGILKGASLRMWRDYFPNAEIYGVDNFQGLNIQDQRISCLRADTRSADDLSKVYEILKNKSIYLIVDDAGHQENAQKLAIKMLGGLLVTGGLYIIEDATVYGVYPPPEVEGLRYLFRIYSEAYPGNQMATSLVYEKCNQ